MALRKKFFIAANWKSNNTLNDTKHLINNIYNPILFNPTAIEAVVAPCFLHIPWVMEHLSRNYRVSAQTFGSFPFGSYTGEVSAHHVRDYGVGWSFIGHSERRTIFHENEEFLGKKVDLALKNDLKIVYCIGEKIVEKEGGLTSPVLQIQLTTLINHASKFPKSWDKIVIAYEPVWAIGSGKTPTPSEIQSIHSEIRDFITAKVSEAATQKLRIIYGGSCNAENTKEFINCDQVDGFMLGAASLKPEFAQIIENVKKARI